MTTNGETLPLPLEGLRVLDATHIVAGPYCAMILADMGAEVIKVERPGAGDRARGNHPFVAGPDGENVSARFLGVNRNKKSITLDLREPRCKEAFEEMIKVSDVLLDNWGPGALRRLGLGYDRLQEINPALIYASITGYGTARDCAAHILIGRPITPVSKVWAGGWRLLARPMARPRWSEIISEIQFPESGQPWA